MQGPILCVMRVNHTQMRDVYNLPVFFRSYLRAMRDNAGYFAGYARYLRDNVSRNARCEIAGNRFSWEWVKSISI